MNAEPRFPAIAISPGDSFLVIDEPIRQCSYTAWRNGYFEGLVLFDSAGLVWPTHTSLLQPLRFYDRFRRGIPVEVQYGQPREDAQVEAVAMLEKLIDEDSTDLYDQFLSRSELKALLRSARNAAELVSAARHLGAEVDAGSDAETT